ncbi:MAG: hypothetical protein IT449_05010 [Phycisphaerales bacterium]|nr:hypothetical protein [Phycisphaerales bacterium]
MQAELDAADTLRPIHILGINEVGLESGNEGMMAGRVLPWLQATEDADVWATWEVEFRDVVILDPDNHRETAYNLTEHDLSNAENYEALKNLLIDLANRE